MNDVVVTLLSWLNSIAGVVARILLAPIAWLPGWLSATLVASVTGVLLLIAFKYTSNQLAIKPNATSELYESFARPDMRVMRMNSTRNRVSAIVTPRKPVSSPTTAKIRRSSGSGPAWTGSTWSSGPTSWGS